MRAVLARLQALGDGKPPRQDVDAPQEALLGVQLVLPIAVRGSLAEAFAWLFRVAEGWTLATREKRRREAEWLMRALGEDTQLGAIGYETLCGYVASAQRAGLAIPTVKARLDCLRLALSEAVRRGLLAELPPWPRLIDTRPRRAKRAPSLAEYQAVRAFIPAHHLDWYDCAYWTGMRKSDVSATRRYHLDMVEGTWIRRSTKTKAPPELFPMPPAWRSLLEISLDLRARGETDRLCGGWTNASRDIGRACAAAGIPRFTSNDLRRACRARLIAEGHPPQVIRLWMCHSDDVAATYYDAMNDDLRRVMLAKLKAASSG